MENTTDTLMPTTNPMGLILGVAGGAIAAGVMGLVYHLVANKVGVDYIIAPAVIVGVVVGFVVGHASRLGGMKSAMMAAAIALIFGIVSYGARYFFEFNDVVDTAIQEVAADAAAQGVSVDEVRRFMLDEFANQYPPGGYLGYLQFVVDQGFSIGSRGSDSSDAPIQGGLAWGLLAVEALAAGIAGFGAARSVLTPKAVAMPPTSTPTRP